MSFEITDSDKSIEDTRFQRGLLKSLLCASINGDNSTLPSMPKYALSEVVNGTVSYLGGSTNGIKCHDFSNDYMFLTVIWQYFQGNVVELGDKLSPKIKDTLLFLIEPSEGGDSRSGMHLGTEFYDHFKGNWGGGISSDAVRSTFQLSFDMVCNNKVLMRGDYFSDEEKRDIIGIGEAMKPFIREDLTYISENYK